MGGVEVQAFLEHLSVERNVSASTQAQALNALVFLYKNVIELPLGEIGAFARARPVRGPRWLGAKAVESTGRDTRSRSLQRMVRPFHCAANLASE